MSLLSIKPYQLNDIDHLISLSIETYHQAFKAFNTRKNMKDYLIRAFTKRQLSAQMKDHRFPLF